MTSTLGSKTTLDAFLGGRLVLEQPAKGYRAGVDPVLLAAAVPARAGQQVLELGCGTGAALLCLGARVSGLALHGVEVQPGYAEMARANADRNGISAQIATADLRHLPEDLRALSFDHVIANPPYFDRAKGNASQQADKDVAFAGDTPLGDWMEAAVRRLKPKGYVSIIQRVERLPECLAGLDGRMGSTVVFPLCGRDGRAPDRFILQSRKGGRAAFRMTAPVALHAGTEHLRDAEDYRPEIAAVLRSGAEFPRPD